MPRALILLLFSLLCIGCGQTGPLYLPDASEPPKSEPDDSDATQANSAALSPSPSNEP